MVVVDDTVQTCVTFGIYVTQCDFPSLKTLIASISLLRFESWTASSIEKGQVRSVLGLRSWAEIFGAFLSIGLLGLRCLLGACSVRGLGLVFGCGHSMFLPFISYLQSLWILCVMRRLRLTDALMLDTEVHANATMRTCTVLQCCGLPNINKNRSTSDYDVFKVLFPFPLPKHNGLTWSWSLLLSELRDWILDFYVKEETTFWPNLFPPFGISESAPKECFGLDLLGTFVKSHRKTRLVIFLFLFPTHHHHEEKKTSTRPIKPIHH